MTAIRVVFDGKAFVPQQPVSLPPDSEVIVFVEGADSAAQEELDRSIRAYYQAGSDVEDDAWARATQPQSQRACDED